MKKTKLFLLFIAVAIAGACTKTDTTPTGPTMTLTQSATTGTEGSQVTFTVTLAAESGANLKTLTITDGNSNKVLDTTFAKSTTAVNSLGFVYTIPAGTAGTTVTLAFTAAEDNSTTTTQTKSITVTANGGDVNTYSAVLLGSYADPSAGSFYASSTNTVYTVSSANTNQGAVDMAFFYGSSNQYTLAAPNDAVFSNGTSGQITSLGIQNWTTRNATTFKSTTLSDLSSATSAAAITTAYNAGTTFSTASRANLLTAGQVIAFSTQAGKMGLCKIVDATGGDTNGNGEMHIQVVVQK